MGQRWSNLAAPAGDFAPPIAGWPAVLRSAAPADRAGGMALRFLRPHAPALRLGGVALRGALPHRHRSPADNGDAGAHGPQQRLASPGDADALSRRRPDSPASRPRFSGAALPRGWPRGPVPDVILFAALPGSVVF